MFFSKYLLYAGVKLYMEKKMDSIDLTSVPSPLADKFFLGLSSFTNESPFEVSTAE